jgi:hypothetical protein
MLWRARDDEPQPQTDARVNVQASPSAWAPGRARARAGRRFCLVLVKPSHYDNDGYVIQWFRSFIPSNSLAALYGIARDCAERRVLGPDVDIEIHAFDETNARIRVNRIARMIKAAGDGMVMLVGAQSNQFPRALDIARPLRQQGIAVAVGGFHVSGVLSMLDGVDPDLDLAKAMGVSLFAGEAEGRLDEVLRDAAAGSLKPLYNHMADLPALENSPAPFIDARRAQRTLGGTTSFDAGRGCPYQCSFCTIINVQGRKSRRRSPDDVEHIIRVNYAQGLRRFFITDDNFARNKDWEPILDRLIQLRQVEKMKIGFIIQVDTLCHRLPNFIEKCALAGVKWVFIGLENINPLNLADANKRQNRITEYRTMLQAWKAAGVVSMAGYILGFPHDTAESIRHDIEVIKRELPVDLLEFFYLTPLPGSEDHLKLVRAGTPLNPDMNQYDLNHVCAPHPKMSAAEWQSIYREAWQTYLTNDHIETMLKRFAAMGGNTSQLLAVITWFKASIEFEKIHPLETGILRLKYRRDRRPSMPRESIWRFYPRYWTEMATKSFQWTRLYFQLRRIYLRIKHDPKRFAYMDTALTPVSEDDAGGELLATPAAQAYVAQQRTLKAARTGAPQRQSAG